MNLDTINYLYDLHFITQEQKETLSRLYSNGIFSLHDELRCMMYVGVLLLVSGIIMFAENNINTVGQQIIIFMLVMIAGVCLLYAITKGPHYSHEHTPTPGIGYDLIFLGGCSLLSVAIGFSQYAYAIFGGEWALVGLIPGLVFILLAYRYDHRGVLSLGIMNVGSAIGLMVSPFSQTQGFSINIELIAVGIAFGALLLVIAWGFDFSNIKNHFTITYIHLSAHILFIASLAGIVAGEHRLAFTLVLSFLCCCGVYYAMYSRSFLIILVTSIYGYTGVSYLISRVIADTTAQAMYIAISCVTAIVALFAFRKHLQAE